MNLLWINLLLKRPPSSDLSRTELFSNGKSMSIEIILVSRPFNVVSGSWWWPSQSFVRKIACWIQARAKKSIKAHVACQGVLCEALSQFILSLIIAINPIFGFILYWQFNIVQQRVERKFSACYVSAKLNIQVRMLTFKSTKCTQTGWTF